jgi:hypothetical protein
LTGCGACAIFGVEVLMHILPEGDLFSLQPEDDHAQQQCKLLQKNLSLGACLFVQDSTNDGQGLRLAAGAYSIDIRPTDEESKGVFDLLQKACSGATSRLFFHGASLRDDGSVFSVLVAPFPCQ